MPTTTMYDIWLMLGGMERSVTQGDMSCTATATLDVYLLLAADLLIVVD